MESENRIESGFLTLSTEFSTRNRENSVESQACNKRAMRYYKEYSLRRGVFIRFLMQILNDYAKEDTVRKSSIKKAAENQGKLRSAVAKTPVNMI